MTFLKAVQAVNACNRINAELSLAQEGLLRTIRYVQDLRLSSKADQSYDGLDGVDRDLCGLYVKLGSIRSEAANGGITKSE